MKERMSLFFLLNKLRSCIVALITVSSECLNVFELSEQLDGECAHIPVLSWVLEAEVLLISRGWLGTYGVAHHLVQS